VRFELSTPDINRSRQGLTLGFINTDKLYVIALAPEELARFDSLLSLSCEAPLCQGNLVILKQVLVF
jgi:hypothetical protein